MKALIAHWWSKGEFRTLNSAGHMNFEPMPPRLHGKKKGGKGGKGEGALSPTKDHTRGVHPPNVSKHWSKARIRGKKGGGEKKEKEWLPRVLADKLHKMTVQKEHLGHEERTQCDNSEWLMMPKKGRRGGGGDVLPSMFLGHSTRAIPWGFLDFSPRRKGGRGKDIKLTPG